MSSKISSTKSDINIFIGKAWIAIERLVTFWLSNLFDKIKRVFVQAVAVIVLLYGSTVWILMKLLEKK